MNKSELIEKIASDANVPKVTAERCLAAFTSAVTKAVKKGDKVVLIGFGAFALRKRRARNGRNPATGETMKIPAKKGLSFKASKVVNESL